MKEEWKKVKLGELYEVHNGLSKGGNFFGSGYPFLSFSTIFNNWFIPETIKDLVQSTEVERANFSVKAGDVFITRTSETADELGMSCVALKDYPNATYNGFCKRLRPIESDYSLNYKYIGYYLRTKSFRNNFLGLSGAMTTRASLKNDDLLAMEITLPSLPTQQKIASILSAYDDLIENNRKQIKLLEEAAQKLYKEWFVKLNFPGHKTTKIVDGIPEGWKKVKAEDYFEITIGKTPPRKEPKWFSDSKGKKWISIADMGNSGTYILNTSEYLTEEAVKSHNVKIIPANTVLLSFKLTVGRVSITSEEMTTNEAIAHFVTNKDFVIEYLYLHLKNYNYNSLGSTSAISTAINSKIVKSMPIIIPDEKLLKMFSNLMKPYFDKIKNCQFSIVNSQLTRDKLLPKLMNGEFYV